MDFNSTYQFRRHPADRDFTTLTHLSVSLNGLVQFKAVPSDTDHETFLGSMPVSDFDQFTRMGVIIAAGDEPSPVGQQDDALLLLHLISEHAFAGFSSDPHDDHEHEHDGPGTIRNHDRADRTWDPDKVTAVLSEAREG